MGSSASYERKPYILDSRDSQISNSKSGVYKRLLNDYSIQFTIETAEELTFRILLSSINMKKLFLLLCGFQLLNTIAEGFRGGKDAISVGAIADVFANVGRPSFRPNKIAKEPPMPSFGGTQTNDGTSTGGTAYVDGHVGGPSIGPNVGGPRIGPGNNNIINRPRSIPPRTDNRRYRYRQPQQSIGSRYGNTRSNVNRVTKYRASSTESCSRSALSLLPSADGSGYCTSSCYNILGRENAEKCCQSADSIEAYPVTCYPCKLCTF